MKSVSGRVPALGGGELRVARDPVLDPRERLDATDHHGRGEGRDDDQPKRRTPSRTRIALKPSLHVIFFPSA